MKICIVGPGYMTIPPKGWGAVEILIDDYRKTLQQMGHTVEIVNSRDPNLIVWMVNSCNPDFVHIQYDEFVVLAKYFNCKNVAVTSHYGYLEQPDRWDPGYRQIFWEFVNSEVKLFCLSPGIADVYRHAGVKEERLFVTPNGVRNDLFSFTEKCALPHESVYLAKVEPRKMQTKYQKVKGLKFVGNCVDQHFDVSSNSYLGEWSKSKIYSDLTNFANLVLLSDGEAHPLVCMEALSTGLGLVISEFAAANLNRELPFIDVIPREKLSDFSFVENAIIKNREISVKMRNEIREYSQNFDWKITCERYCNLLSVL